MVKLVIGSVARRGGVLVIIASVCLFSVQNLILVGVWNSSGSHAGSHPRPALLLPIASPIVVNISQLLSPPTIFQCIKADGNGMLEVRELFRSILPEYQLEDLPESSVWNKTSNDFDVVLGIESLGCTEDVFAWILTEFKGHIIFTSAESRREHPDASIQHKTNVHYFGPVLNASDNDWVLTYLQTTWWASFRDALPPSAMLDPDLRPRRPPDWNQEIHFMIYANGNCVEYREVAAWRFSKLGEVHCGGPCCGKALDGNQTNLVPRQVGGLMTWRDNVELYKKYKFCLVMEHEWDHKSYLTEKLLMAFIAGCIPVYHGPPDLVFDMFSSASFVFYNVSDPQPSLDLVERLLHDEDLYDQMLHQPIAAKGRTTLQDYFSFSDDIEDGALKRKIRNVLGLSNLVFMRNNTVF